MPIRRDPARIVRRRRAPGRVGRVAVARVAGRQNVATLAGSRVAKKLRGRSLNPSFTPDNWTRTIAITVIIGFLHHLTENIGFKSMSICVFYS